MFTAYEAVPIVPETLELIGTRMGSDANARRWAPLLQTALENNRDRGETKWIVFHCSPRMSFETSPTDHLIVPNQYLLDMFYVARLDGHLHWIALKK